MARSGPEPVGEVISELISRLGLAQYRGGEQREKAWREAVGEPLASVTQIGSVRNRKLDVIVANSTLMQELNFERHRILTKLNTIMPELNVDDLRLRIGPVGNGPE